jgi:hypothetical protein
MMARADRIFNRQGSPDMALDPTFRRTLRRATPGPSPRRRVRDEVVEITRMSSVQRQRPGFFGRLAGLAHRIWKPRGSK